MYECKYYFPNVLYLFLLVPLLIGIYLLRNISNPFVENKIKLLITGSVMMIISLVIILLAIFDYVTKYNMIYKEYKSGHYNTVCGEISDFHAVSFEGNGGDDFTIDDVEFYLSNGFGDPGYNKLACYGGIINKNEMMVEIRYIQYKGKNYIMYIRIIEKPEKKEDG